MSAPSKSSAYHHGNLRQALLDAARALASENSVDSITLREVARRAGVSHAAPYHHFADKRALLRALAIAAFVELHDRLRSQKQADPTANLNAIGLVYVQFALAHPVEFHFMFRKSLCEPPGKPDELTDIANQTLEMLIETIRTLQDQGIVVPGDTQSLALLVWSAIHGLAHILIETPMVAEPITAAVVERLTQTLQTTLQQGLFVR
jgi:AcrR family transcriptional regulator